MRKLPIAIAVGALAVSVAAVPAIAKPGPKGAKNVVSTITLVASPTTIEPTTETVAVSGNIKANSSCRKNRTVHFSYEDENGTTALTETAVTGPNGDYSATLPKPTTTVPVPASVTLVATVDEALRVTKGQSKGKGKKKGHKKKAKKFNCLGATAQTALTVN
jgi:hypothetical protein